MLQTTKTIVLRTVKYGETSIITTLYTEAFGLQSYLVNGVRTTSKKGATKSALFQPAALLEVVAYHNEFKNLQRLKEFDAARREFRRQRVRVRDVEIRVPPGDALLDVARVVRYRLYTYFLQNNHCAASLNNPEVDIIISGALEGNFKSQGIAIECQCRCTFRTMKNGAIAEFWVLFIDSRVAFVLPSVFVTTNRALDVK